MFTLHNIRSQITYMYLFITPPIYMIFEKSKPSPRIFVLIVAKISLGLYGMGSWMFQIFSKISLFNFLSLHTSPASLFYTHLHHVIWSKPFSSLCVSSLQLCILIVLYNIIYRYLFFKTIISF